VVVLIVLIVDVVITFRVVLVVSLGVVLVGFGLLVVVIRVVGSRTKGILAIACTGRFNTSKAMSLRCQVI
jgi:hypothetical protein